MNNLEPIEAPRNQFPLDVTSTLPDQIGGSDDPDSWQERDTPPTQEPIELPPKKDAPARRKDR